MGCDGGTIPKRDELVRTKKKPEEKDKEAEAIAKWKYCALSCEKLRKPIVSCMLGRLYNKEAIINYLLEKDSNPNEVVEHIKNLKDVKELILTEKNNYEEKCVENGTYIDVMDSQFICPIVGIEMNGKYKFSYIRTCGCVVSERALKEIKSDNCVNCNKPFDEDKDVVPINGTQEEINQQKKKIEEMRAKEKLEKKTKKRKLATVCKEEESKPQSSNKKSTVESVASSSKTTKTSTSALLTEKASTDYSVAKDEKASEVYKSIFTSHKSAQNKPKAHWVTFNPLYF